MLNVTLNDVVVEKVNIMSKLTDRTPVLHMKNPRPKEIYVFIRSVHH